MSQNMFRTHALVEGEFVYLDDKISLQKNQYLFCRYFVFFKDEQNLFVGIHHNEYMAECMDDIIMAIFNCGQGISLGYTARELRNLGHSHKLMSYFLKKPLMVPVDWMRDWCETWTLDKKYSSLTRKMLHENQIYLDEMTRQFDGCMKALFVETTFFVRPDHNVKLNMIGRPKFN